MKKMIQFFKGKKFFRYSLVAMAVLISVAVVYAATVPYTFTSGTVAKSSEVNSNFSYLADRSWEKSESNLYYSNGNVGIGTSSPDRNLVVAGSTAGQIKIDSATGYDSVLFLSENNSVKWAIYNDVSNDNNLTFERGGGERLVTIARTSGNVGIGTTSPSYPLHMASGAYVTTGGVWTNASSRTYKEHIAELTSNEAIAAFQGLKPVTYNYKVDKDEKHIGFIAEDVPSILATKDRKGVSSMDVVALLTKVVQEQQKTISELKKEVEGMKKEKM